jgi:hypothetical protein
VFLIGVDASVARTSTAFGPWLSKSSSSIRLGLAMACPMRANWL